MGGLQSHGTQVLLAATYPIKWCKDITLPSPTSDEIDITVLDDCGKVTIAGDVDYGEVAFEINYHPGEYTHYTLRQLSQTQATGNWKVVMVDPGTEEWAFSGWVKTFAISAPVSGVYTAQVAIKVTGLPTIS